ncbi:hypothetical protein J7T55_013126 [Diaporthe amygdali]|uniref:uncharacterized protein n=1 Tax=Phomopsis amygdali TaxID=1214568 RepID=UPI0022FE8823|nr:uncharacterized protein J7T55_013126 [Diaporthe amygdali]KAJ0118870.1 hypothetical protein J7T55_013126 [Diaporthe amygdali]
MPPISDPTSIQQEFSSAISVFASIQPTVSFEKVPNEIHVVIYIKRPRLRTSIRPFELARSLSARYWVAAKA